MINSLGITGHRPDKLPGGYNLNHQYYQDLWYIELNILLELINDYNINDIRLGGALGVDQFIFDVALYLRENIFKNLEIHLSLPCKYMDSKWFKSSKEKLRFQISVADSTTYVDTLDNYKIANIPVDIYHPAKMQKRNMHIVDTTTIMHTIWNGDRKGGTYNCLKYAESLHRPIIILNPNTFKKYYIQKG